MVAPATEYPDELTSQQRAALLTYHLFVLGRTYTTEEVATLVGLSVRGALYLLDMLSSTQGLPLTKTAGRWMSVTLALELAAAAEMPPFVRTDGR